MAARGWKASIPFTVGEFIQYYLSANGEAYPYQIYKALKEACRRRGFKWFGTYGSFRRQMEILLKLGLIEPAGVEQAEKPYLHPRRLYRIRRGMEAVSAWRIPQYTLYPHTVYGRRLYHQKKQEAQARGITVGELAQLEHPEILRARRELGLPTP